MTKNRKFASYVTMTIIVCSIFSVTFSIGIFYNPNFDIFDFFYNLATDLIGAVVTAGVVGVYIKTKTDYLQQRIDSSDTAENREKSEELEQ